MTRNRTLTATFGSTNTHDRERRANAVTRIGPASRSVDRALDAVPTIRPGRLVAPRWLTDPLSLMDGKKTISATFGFG
jgi:hypothetical protein